MKAKILVLLPLAGLMMGNQQCQEQPQGRELRRRVEMGQLKAPAMTLPEGGKFDFQFAANAQLYDVLRKTQSFSTSTMDGTFQLEQMTMQDREAFNSCDDVVTNNESAMRTNSKLGEISEVATCMINAPQAVIEGGITGFDLVNSVGLNLNLFGALPLGASFEMKQAKLTMAFTAEDPFIPGHVLAANTSSAKQQQFSVGATINFGGFGIGPTAYFKSALADVVNKAMVNGITDLKKQMDANSPWYTTVYRNCDKAILINAGGAADAGLKEGDVLEIYNVLYSWNGKVCESTLNGSVPKTEMVATAVVKRVGDTISLAELVGEPTAKIQPGSRVYVRKLIEPVQPKSGTKANPNLAKQ